MEYTVSDDPKTLRETLCVAQQRIGASPYDRGRKEQHMQVLQRLINECDRHRPLGIDGKHGNRHTPTCGCEDKGSEEEWVVGPGQSKWAERCPRDGQTLAWHRVITGSGIDGYPPTQGEYIGCSFGVDQ